LGLKKIGEKINVTCMFGEISWDACNYSFLAQAMFGVGASNESNPITLHNELNKSFARRMPLIQKVEKTEKQCSFRGTIYESPLSHVFISS
jgi:hypothetical protein